MAVPLFYWGMGKKDPRIDAYIAQAADFARPILKHVRKLVHAGCPEVVEKWKWSFPNFDHNGPLCHMAAFKNHCSLGFWKGALFLKERDRQAENEAMGQFGRIASVSDLPGDKVLLGYIREAARLNDQGIKLPPRPKSKLKKELVVPNDLVSGLKKNRKALAAFDNFSYSHKKDYVDWITEAKREKTRKQRLETTLAWLSEAKPRHWKYLKA
jgi:uncharacterized protein YdeI (YjbR/CyaY-like superfamily)